MAPNNENYIIPFGIDPGVFFEGLKDMSKATTTLENGVVSANKSMSDSFSTSTKAAEDLKTKMKASTEAALVLRGTARELGKDLATALSVKGNGKQIEELVSKYQNELFKLQKNSKVNIDVVFNKATIQEIANAAGGATNELEFLNQALAEAKTTLAGMDTNSEEFASLNQQIQLSEGLLEGLGQAEKIAETGAKSLKAQLKEMKADLAAMEIAGKGGTAEFREMSIRAGELEDQIGDVSARVRVLASDTKYLDAGVQAITAIAGGFALAQGAAALFGDENEAVNEALKKVTAAMAILQGIQAIANALNKDSALNVLLFSRAQATATVTTTALAGATTAEAGATVAATAATKGFTAALLANPLIAVAALLVGIVATFVSYITAADEAAIATKNFNDQLETQAELLKLDESGIKRRTDLLVAQAKAQGKSESEIEKIQSDALKSKLELYKRDEEETVAAYNKALKMEEMSAEDFKKVSDNLLQSRERVKDAENEIQVKRFEDQAAANKRIEADNKKALEEFKKTAEARKKINEQIVSFTKVLQDSQLAAMKNGFEKERVQAQNDAQQRIADLNKETALSEEAEKIRGEAIQSIKKELAIKLNDIDSNEKQTRFELEISASRQLIDLRKDSMNKELDLLNVEQVEREAAINAEFKDEQFLRESLLDRLGESIAARRKEIALKYKQQEIDENEKRELLVNELLTGYALKPVAIEEQKQREILKVQIKYAEERLNALVASGAGENDVAVLQAKATVAQMKQALKDSGKDSPLTLFSLLGLDSELTAEEQSKISGYVDSIKKSVKQLTDYLIAQNQREIDMRNENIDRIDAELENLEDSLDREKEAKRQGFAYSTKVIEDEIAAQQKQKDEEIQLRNEAVEEKKKIQKIAAAIDTAQQISAISTAAANVIEGWSSIPFVGSILGAVAVAAMIAAFIASKASAAKAAKGETFEEGGWITGKRHTQGGHKYYAEDGSYKELEDGEHITNRVSAQRFAPLLDAINEDRLAGMSSDAIRGLLADTGVHLSDEIESGVSQSRQLEQNRELTINNPNSPELQSIDNNISLLVKRDRDKVETWEDEQFFYKKRGNRTTKIRK